MAEGERLVSLREITEENRADVERLAVTSEQANYVASKAQLGGAVYAGIKMLRKKKAGGLPDKVMIAVTPAKVYAFKLKVGRDYKLGDEVAVWDRGGIVASSDRSGGMTALTIESPSEGEKVTLVGISVKDDPVSQELMGVLQGNPAQPG